MAVWCGVAGLSSALRDDLMVTPEDCSASAIHDQFPEYYTVCEVQPISMVELGGRSREPPDGRVVRRRWSNRPPCATPRGDTRGLWRVGYTPPHFLHEPGFLGSLFKNDLVTQHQADGVGPLQHRRGTPHKPRTSCFANHHTNQPPRGEARADASASRADPNAIPARCGASFRANRRESQGYRSRVGTFGGD
jgi:hypothetical protein